MIKNQKITRQQTQKNKDSSAVRNIKKGFKVSQLEAEMLAEKCKSAGLTESEYVRTVAIYDAIVIANNSTNLIKATVELNRVGNNINQIARKLNSGNELTSQLVSELKDTITAVNYLTEQLNKEVKKQSHQTERRTKKCLLEDLII